MKSDSQEKRDSLIVVLILITLFVFIISFSVFYISENFSSVCGCTLPIWVILISISSFGLFTGSFIYYFMNRDSLKKNKVVKKSFNKFFNFLEKDERKILEFVLKNSNEVHQSVISKELNLDKVRVSRVINTLESKGIIIKKKKGMTNLIILHEDFYDIF